MTKRLGLALVLLAVFVASLTLACSFPLVDPDEGRNAEVAREMARDGDVVIPHLAGMAYLDKPPALFAAAALAIRAFGVRPWAARLPAAVAAVATLALLAAAARRLGTHAFAVRAVALLAVAPLFAVLSAYVLFDMPLTLCVTAVWTLLARELETGASPGRRAAMFAAVTLGVLLKGPVMLAWILGGSAVAALLLRSRAPLRWLAWWPGWAMVFAVAGGWFALASRRYPEYPRYAFLEESLERMSRSSFKREQPWWFVPAVLAGGALPWSFATPWSRARWRRADQALKPSLAVALGFVLFAAVFFTLSHSKLVTYLLPALPPLAWIAAAMWSDSAPRLRSAWTLAVFYAVAALVAIGFAGMPGPGGASRQPLLDPAVAAGCVRLAIGLAAAAALAGYAALTRRRGLAFVTALLFAPLALTLGHPLLQVAARNQSGAPLAAAVTGLAGRPPALRYEHCYSPGTDFLLDRVSGIVSDRGFELTSNYQLRYRDRLRQRGQWTPQSNPPADSTSDVIVRRAGDPLPPPAGFERCFEDARFVAWRRARTP